MKPARGNTALTLPISNVLPTATPENQLKLLTHESMLSNAKSGDLTESVTSTNDHGDAPQMQSFDSPN